MVTAKGFSGKLDIKIAMRMIISLALTLVGTVLFVSADIMIVKGRWPIVPGVFVLIPAMFAAYIGLDLPALPHKTQRGNWLFGLVPLVPVIVVIISGGATTNNPYLVRGLLIIAAGALGIAFRRKFLFPPEMQFEQPRAIFWLDLLRQGLLMLVVLFGSLVYVSAPSLQIFLN